jgi:hypothetical protein
MKLRITMRLTEARSTLPRDWRPLSRWPLDSFRNVDAADLGDLEDDPAIKRLLHENFGAIGERHAR